MPIFFRNLRKNWLQSLDVVRFKIVDIQMVNTDHGRDFHPLADNMTKIRTFTKGEIREFSTFPFSLYLMFDQTLSNILVCLTILQNYMQKLHKRAGMLQWILGRFNFSQN